MPRKRARERERERARARASVRERERERERDWELLHEGRHSAMTRAYAAAIGSPKPRQPLVLLNPKGFMV